MKAIFLFFIALAGLSGCASKDVAAPASITVSYAETQCADPWLRSVSVGATGYVPDNVRTQAIINYLKSNGVSSARDVTFQEPTAQFNCQACTCPSGRTIRVTINESEWEQASKLGFKR